MAGQQAIVVLAAILRSSPLAKGQYRRISLMARFRNLLFGGLRRPEFMIRDAALRLAAAVPPAPQALSPFPRQCTEVLGALWPDQLINLNDEAVQRDLAEKLIWILSTQELKSFSVLAGYARFLRAAWEHFQFVQSYLPTINKERLPSEKGFRCKQSSANEMISIAHHLFGAEVI